jgi:Uma2 family endonuclease
MSTVSKSTTERAVEPPGISRLGRPKDSVPILRNGDRLTGVEFDRRYAAMPHLKKAELIEGRVYLSGPDFRRPDSLESMMASPVTFHGHASPHFQANGWLYLYSSATSGVLGGDNGTLRLDLDNRPQPDIFLLIDPALGGHAQIDEDDYVVGGPELIVEIAHTTASYDLHDKLNVYRRNGVSEYVIWRVEDDALDWFVLRDGTYERLALADDNTYRSTVFPGLWLDPEALLTHDSAKVIETAQRGLASAEHAAFVEKMAGRKAASQPAKVEDQAS